MYDECLHIAITHAPETGAINRLHFSDASFWYVCHANLGPDSSGTTTRFWLQFKVHLFGQWGAANCAALPTANAG